MSTLANRVVRQHGFLAAAITSVGILLVIIVQYFLSELMTLATQPVLWANGSNILATIWTGLGVRILGGALFFAIGVLLSLWFVAPIAGELRLMHVVTRSVLASGLGAVLAIIVTIVIGFITAFTFRGSLFGNSFPTPSFSGSSVAMAVPNGLQNGVNLFIVMTPLVVLGGILLWNWLMRHPSKHEVSGMVDAV